MAGDVTATESSEENGSATKSIVMLSTADWDADLWTNKQHSAVTLAEMGFRVLYVESIALRPPRASRTDAVRILRRVFRAVALPRRVSPGVFTVSPPVLPIQRYHAFRTLNRWLVTAVVCFWARVLLDGTPVLWTYNPMTTGLLRVPRNWYVLYHCVDRVDAQPGMPRQQMKLLERDLVRAADEVFVTSRSLEREWREVRADVQYLPNCVDLDHFRDRRAAPSEWDVIPSPRIGFVGAMADYKVDYDLLDKVFSEHSTWSLVLVGPDQDASAGLQSLRQLPNVHWLGRRSYAEVPAYMQHFDVAIIPARLNEYTSAMFPMKFFEYLAAGAPVVATQLDALAEYAEVCRLASSAEDFARGIEAALSEEAVPADRQSTVLADNTYVTRTERMIASLRVRSR